MLSASTLCLYDKTAKGHKERDARDIEKGE